MSKKNIQGLLDLGIHSVYIAGPMSGVKEYNFPLFNSVAYQLRNAGMTVFNPAELDDPAVVAKTDPLDITQSGGEQWQRYLKRDLLIITTFVQAIIALPNWQDSKGACLETHTAFELSMPVLRWPDLVPVTEAERLESLINVTAKLMIPDKMPSTNGRESREKELVGV